MKNQDGLRITIPRASEGLRSRFRRLHPARKLPGLKMPKKGEGMERWGRRKIWPAVMFIFYSRLDWLDVSDSDHCTGRFPKFWSLIHGFFWEVLSSLLSVSRCDALQSYDWGEEWPYADLGFYMVATASGNGNTSREVLNIIASWSRKIQGAHDLQFWEAEDYVFGVIYLIEICIKICGLKMDFFKDRTISVGWRLFSSTWNLIPHWNFETYVSAAVVEGSLELFR